MTYSDFEDESDAPPVAAPNRSVGESVKDAAQRILQRLRTVNLKTFGSKRAKTSATQLRYEELIADVTTVFPSATTVILSTRWGDVLARHPRVSLTERSTPIDDGSFRDIPKAMRDEDDAMTAGDMEFQELRTGIAIAVRMTRRYVLDALTPDRDPAHVAVEGPGISPATNVPSSPLFSTVGFQFALFCYGVDAEHILAFNCDAADYSVDTTENDDRLRPVLENVRLALAGAAQAPMPVRPPRRWGRRRRTPE